MRPEYETLRLDEPIPHVTVVTMDRPRALNAMNTQMMADLRDCFASFYVDQGDTRCLVLTGAGEKGFCAGADLKERNGMSDEAWRRQHAIVEQAIRAIMDCPIPVIAAVNGAAFAGGCELALACDFIYAASHARFAQTEVALGIIPGAMGTQNLPRAVGVRRAKELILTATPFSAQEAFAWGLVNRIAASDKLLAEALATAKRIAANAPVAVRQAKRSMDKSQDLDRGNGYGFEIEAYNRTVGTADREEGIRAFNEKRKPDFKGR
ncbi:MAG: enoyl-CoA hydratase/isomerase family protein [Hyphomicrobiaceae bacterium]|nr:enoyl-CoA hydratase/isomerase family protein [Hyphomicrobiaceae bacterium]